MRELLMHSARVFAFVCSTLHVADVIGQIAPVPSASQEATARQMLSAQGVDEDELRARLIGKGIDIDNLTTAELVSARPIIEQTIAEIKAESGDQTNVGNTSSRRGTQVDQAVGDVIEEGLDEAAAVKESIEDGASVEEARAEAAIDQQNAASAADPIRVYGQQLFRGKSLEVFRATDQARAPATYVLDTGDEIAISIFGASQIDFLLTIGDDGFVKPAGIQRIYLRGRTLAEARELVRSRFSQFFVFGQGQFSLTLDAARTISVSIYGEVQQSGTYTLSALNGPLNALIAAGGPTDRGSLRNITLSREGERTRIDVYEFLARPERAPGFLCATVTSLMSRSRATSSRSKAESGDP